MHARTYAHEQVVKPKEVRGGGGGGPGDNTKKFTPETGILQARPPRAMKKTTRSASLPGGKPAGDGGWKDRGDVSSRRTSVDGGGSVGSVASSRSQGGSSFQEASSSGKGGRGWAVGAGASSAASRGSKSGSDRSR